METNTDIYAAIPLPLDLGGGHSITALYPATALDEVEQAICAAAPGNAWTEVVIDGGRTLRLSLDLSDDALSQVHRVAQIESV